MMARAAVGAKPCLVSSFKISSFARKPVSGGRLAKDRRRKGSRVVRMGFFAPRAKSAFTEVTFLRVKRVNVAYVTII